MDLHDATQFYYDCIAPHHDALPATLFSDHGKACMVCGTHTHEYILDTRPNQAQFGTRCPACNVFFESWTRAFGRSGNLSSLLSKATKGWVVVVSQDGLSLFRNENVKAKPKKDAPPVVSSMEDEQEQVADAEAMKGWPEIPDERGLHPFVTRVDAPSAKAARFLAVCDAMNRLQAGQTVMVFATNDKYSDFFGSIRPTMDATAFFYGKGASLVSVDMEKWFPRVKLLSDFLMATAKPGSAPKKKVKDTKGTDEDSPNDPVTVMREVVLKCVQAVTLKEGVRCCSAKEDARLRKTLVGFKRDNDERSCQMANVLLEWLNLPDAAAELVNWLIGGAIEQKESANKAQPLAA